MNTQREIIGEMERDYAADKSPPRPDVPAFRKIEDILATDNGAAIIHNFDGDKMDQYRLTAIATGGACQPFEAIPVDGLDLKYWFCHRAEMVSKTGEIITPVRTVLIDKGGNAFSFVSDGIARELDTLRTLFGDGPYTDPMKVKVSKIKTRSGGHTYCMGPA
jgi:hypothetical protein